MSFELLLPIKHRNKTLLMSKGLDNRITKRLRYVMLRILAKIHVGSETNWKVGSGSRSSKITPNPQHWKYAKKLIFVGTLKVTTKKRRIRIRNPVYRSKDPDPFQNVTDPEHSRFLLFCSVLSDIPIRHHNTQLGVFHNGPMGMGKLQKLFLIQNTVAACQFSCHHTIKASWSCDLNYKLIVKSSHL